MMRRFLALVLPALVLSAPVGAQQGGFDLTVQNIMRGPELYGREPGQVRFTADGQWIYFRWLEPGAKWNEDTKPYRVAARAGATPELVTDAHMDSVAPMLASGPKSRDGRSAWSPPMATSGCARDQRGRASRSAASRRPTPTSPQPEVLARRKRDLLRARQQRLRVRRSPPGSRAAHGHPQRHRARATRGPQGPARRTRRAAEGPCSK
jgi:hypothetical protein